MPLKYKDKLKTFHSLNCQLNIAFALVLLIPMFLATIFSINHFAGKIEKQTLHKIDSDMKIVGLLFENMIDEIKNTAEFYSENNVVTKLIPFDLVAKIGAHLAKGIDRKFDMLTVISGNHNVIVRAHSNQNISSTGNLVSIKSKKYVNEAIKRKETIAGVSEQEIKNAAKTKHFGIHSITERVKNLGGEIKIESSPGGGTTIFIEMRISNGYDSAD